MRTSGGVERVTTNYSVVCRKCLEGLREAGQLDSSRESGYTDFPCEQCGLPLVEGEVYDVTFTP